MMSTELRMGKGFAIGLLLLAVSAELVASVAVWHGTPTDWTGEPLHFWEVELSRLRYWCETALVFAGLWLIGWIFLYRRFAAPALVALGGCALAADVITSVYFWKSLNPAHVGYLGWSSLPRYIEEHLISWIIVTLLALTIWYVYV